MKVFVTFHVDDDIPDVEDVRVWWTHEEAERHNVREGGSDWEMRGYKIHECDLLLSGKAMEAVQS